MIISYPLCVDMMIANFVQYKYKSIFNFVSNLYFIHLILNIFVFVTKSLKINYFVEFLN